MSRREFFTRQSNLPTPERYRFYFSDEMISSSFIGQAIPKLGVLGVLVPLMQLTSSPNFLPNLSKHEVFLTMPLLYQKRIEFHRKVVSQIIFHFDNKSILLHLFNGIINCLRMAHNQVIIQIYCNKDNSLFILFPQQTWINISTIESNFMQNFNSLLMILSCCLYRTIDSFIQCKDIILFSICHSLWNMVGNNTDFKSLNCIQDTCSWFPKELMIWDHSSIFRHQIVLKYCCTLSCFCP